MKPTTTALRRASAILLMLLKALAMMSCEREERRHENEQRQELSEELDKIERLNLEEVEFRKQEFEAVKDMPRKEGHSRRIDKHAQAERKRNGTQNKLAGRTERVNRLRKAIPEGDPRRKAEEIAGMPETAKCRKEMAERALQKSRGNQRAKRGSGASRLPSGTGGTTGLLAHPARLSVYC